MNRRTMVVLLLLVIWVEAPLSRAWAEPEAGGDAAAERREEDYYELYKTLADALDQVERNYVEKISRRELMDAAIEGVIHKLDPYSTYIKREDLREFKTGVENEFGGIGISIRFDRGELKVVSPLIGTPAYRAGMQAGDLIIEIDGKPTKDIQKIDEAVRRMKGPIGTEVTIKVVRNDSDEPIDFEITRDLIHIETVVGEGRNRDDTWKFLYDTDRRIGYVRITAFSRETVNELRAALDRLQKQKMRGLVVDLRFNPGGLLTSAVEVSDLFIADGTIVSTEGRNTEKRVWKAHQEGTYKDFPMVVLVNRFSASASEILSACLQDHDRAVIVGERTWGKGSVQTVIELDNGRSALKLTTASYQRPNGENIHRFTEAKDSDQWGVKPNPGFEITLSDKEVRQLIRRQYNLNIINPDRATDDEDDEVIYTDRQIERAIDYLSGELARAE